jgi:hypothetical protein
MGGLLMTYRALFVVEEIQALVEKNISLEAELLKSNERWRKRRENSKAKQTRKQAPIKQTSNDNRSRNTPFAILPSTPSSTTRNSKRAYASSKRNNSANG